MLLTLQDYEKTLLRKQILLPNIRWNCRLERRIGKSQTNHFLLNKSSLTAESKLYESKEILKICFSFVLFKYK